ncbi:polysaccharide lyase family 7 protein [Alienimonas chondri]|uniref:Alginate lyase n=1 Tax=Alienimonas chondri TaxID=2681879 RepID=A0ABX1VEK5_9PLAN|nr:polysaccharide lyase family 7 protein [Alienimonas chondri]NNJ25940.1 Alginate lyase [Alienimonas chondri]
MTRSLTLLGCLLVSAGAEEAPAPGERLDLSHWYLTLPVDTARPGKPDEIEQPELATFVDPRFFYVSQTPAGVAFRAPCGGDTTKSSGFPRCELRELNAETGKDACWGTDDGGRHTMVATLAVTALPPVKQHVVCAQIHDKEDDICMIRLEGQKLFVERNDLGDVRLDSDYALGTPFTVKIEAAGGAVRVWYDDELKLTWKTKAKGCYFKAGCYTQSNVSKGDAADSYGEVVISALKVTHAREDSAADAASD